MTEDEVKKELEQALVVVVEVAKAIREAGEVPAGTLYAVLADQMTERQFEGMINLLTRGEEPLVVRENDLLKWIG